MRPLPGAGVVLDFFVAGDGDAGHVVVATRERVGVVPLRAGRAAGRVRWVLTAPRIRFVRPHPRALAWVGSSDGIRLLARDGAARRVVDGDVWRYGEPAVDAAGRLLAGVERRYLMRTLRLAPDGRVELAAGHAEGLDNTLPIQLTFDPEGGFWIASDAGLTRLTSEAVRLYPLRAPGDVAEIAHAMAGDPARGVLWVATWGGMYRFDGGRLVRASGPVRRATSAPVLTPSGAWWEEFQGGSWRWEDGRLRRVPDGQPAPIFANTRGRVEGESDGCYHVRGGRRVRVGPPCRPGAVGVGGVVWLFRDGPGETDLDALVGDSLASACRACAPPGLRAALAAVNRAEWYGVVADRDGRAWLHGSRGVAALWAEGGRWRARWFGTDDGLLSRDAGALAVSPDGTRLWVGTQRGIQGLRLAAGAPAFDAFVELRGQDGLPGERVTGLVEDGDGRLWVSVGAGAVLRMDWRALRARAPSPAVRVEGLEVAGRRAALAGGALRLRTGDPLVVRLAARTYRQAARVRLEYRLGEGAWTDLGAGRTVAFAALPAGRHALAVRAVREGRPPGPAVHLPLRVVPPVWRRPWFAVLVLGVGAAGAYGAYRAREGRRHATEALRARIAGDLHDEVGTGLTEVSLYSELIRRAAAAPGGDGGDVAAWAGRVGERARSLSGSVRDLAWAIRPDEEAWEALELRIKDAAVALLAPQGVEVDVRGEAEGAPPPLPLDVRTHVLLFAKEALHNAARHAGARRVEVRWRLTRHALALRIRDDGRGFEPAAVREGTGLGSLRRRAAELGATLVVEAAPGAGTALALDVPLRRKRLPERVGDGAPGAP